MLLMIISEGFTLRVVESSDLKYLIFGNPQYHNIATSLILL